MSNFFPAFAAMLLAPESSLIRIFRVLPTVSGATCSYVVASGAVKAIGAACLAAVAWLGPEERAALAPVAALLCGEPERVLSLTSLSSTTGSRRVGFQDPRLLPHLLRRAGRSREL